MQLNFVAIVQIKNIIGYSMPDTDILEEVGLKSGFIVSTEDGLIFKAIVSEQNFFLNLVADKCAVPELMLPFYNCTSNILYLAVFGDACEGAVYQISDKECKKLSTIPNWAPIIEICAYDLYKESFGSYKKETLMICSGIGNRGTVRQIRWGFDMNTIASTKAEYQG